MSLLIRHATLVDVNLFPDDPQYAVGSDEWNANHTVLMGASSVIGRTQASAGPAHEVAVGGGLQMSEVALSLAPMLANSVKGNPGADVAAPIDIQASSVGDVLTYTVNGLEFAPGGGVSIDSVGNDKLANVPPSTLKGRIAAGFGDPQDLTGAQATSLLDAFTDSLKGLAPPSGGGTSNFLRADGTWIAPPAGGGVAVVAVGDSPPASPVDGQLWWASNRGQLFIWYNDGTSSPQWVVVGAFVPAPTSAASYSNPGSTGDRTSIISVSTNIGSIVGSITNLVDGDFSSDGNGSHYWTGGFVNDYVKFDFGTAKLITEAKWYQNTTQDHGSWKWQGSNNDSTWTDIGSAFTLGGATPFQTITALSGNTTAYRYYRLVLLSAAGLHSGPWNQEIEFKIV